MTADRVVKREKKRSEGVERNMWIWLAPPYWAHRSVLICSSGCRWLALDSFLRRYTHTTLILFFFLLHLFYSSLSLSLVIFHLENSFTYSESIDKISRRSIEWGGLAQTQKDEAVRQRTVIAIMKSFAAPYGAPIGRAQGALALIKSNKRAQIVSFPTHFLSTSSVRARIYRRKYYVLQARNNNGNMRCYLRMHSQYSK